MIPKRKISNETDNHKPHHSEPENAFWVKNLSAQYNPFLLIAIYIPSPPNTPYS